LCAAPWMVTFGTYSTCPLTLASRVRVKSFPNRMTLTLAGVRVVSCRFAPVRALSLCWVSTDGGAAGDGRADTHSASDSADSARYDFVLEWVADMTYFSSFAR